MLPPLQPPSTWHPHPKSIRGNVCPSSCLGHGITRHVDRGQMQVTYLSTKRNGLLTYIDERWGICNQRSYHDTATLLGHTHTASTTLPLGSYFSIRLQQWLNTCLVNLEAPLPSKVSKTTPACRIKAIWHTDIKIQVPAHIARDIMLVRQLLVSPLAYEIWNWPIGLLIPRSPHITLFTDASYMGSGDFSVAFNFK